jgi:hypothetical protein
MRLFGGSRTVSPLSISGHLGVKANTSSQLWAAPGTPRDFGRFGSHGSADAPQLKVLLAPYPLEKMVAWPVSPRVGNVKNDDPEPDRSRPLARVRHGELGDRPEEAMNWHRWVAALLVMLALAACAQGGQVPYAPYSPENMHDRGGDM